MKNEIKILIAAIVVILIVLVGAFALSGSNNPQPTATPTVTPVTATPTPVPANGGSNGAGTPSPSVVAPTPTPVPSVTPTPMPESGVKQTEFGYWITYPPLPPQNWSTNPPPNVGSGNIVFFDPTYGRLGSDWEPDALDYEGAFYEAYIYRTGNLSEEATVTIHMTYSPNVEWNHYKDESSRPDYWVSMHGDSDDVFTELENGYYEVTFEPGVSGQYVCIHVDGIFDTGAAFERSIPEAWVQLTLTEATNGFGIDDARKDFLLDIKDLPTSGPAIVQYVGTSDTFTVGTANGTKYDFYIPITRTGGDIGSPLTVSLTGYGSDWSMEYFSFYSGTTFAAGESTANVHIFATGGTELTPKTGVLAISSTSEYTVGTNDQFTITIQFPSDQV